MKKIPGEMAITARLARIVDNRVKKNLLAVCFLLAEVLIGYSICVYWYGSGHAIPLVVIVPAAMVVVLCILFWRKSVYFLFFYVCVEGLVSLWLYPWRAPLLFKDFIIILIYIGFLTKFTIQRKQMLFRSPLTVPLLLLASLGVIQLFNPNLRNLTVGLIGIRTLLLYIPLLFIGYHFIQTKEQLHKFGTFLVILAIPVSIVAVFQYFVGPNAIAGLGPGFARSVVAVGTPLGYTVFRPTSTFSYAGGLGGYILVMIFLTICFINFRVRGWTKWIFVISLVWLILGLAANTQRSTMLLLSIGIPVMYILQKKGIASSSLPFLVGSCLLLAWFVLPAFFYRLDSIVRDPYGVIVQKHLIDPAVVSISRALSSSPLGRGMGYASPGTRYVITTSIFIESFIAYLIYELGIVGFALYVWVCVSLVRLGFRIHRGLSDSSLRWLAIGLVVYQLAIFGISGTYTPLNFPPTNVYFWFFVGVMMKLPIIDISEEAASVT